MLQRLLRISVICIAATAFAACGDDPEPEANNTPDTGTDRPDAGTDESDADTDVPETDTDVPETDTDLPPEEQCAAIGDACDLTAPTAAGFVCEDPQGDGTGECFQGCTPPATAEEQYPCPAGRICVPLSQGGPALCLPSDCTGILADDCDAGEECFALRNDAFLCLPAGTAAEGASCADTDGSLNFDACAEGLRCSPLTGTCEVPCGDDSACGDAACVGEAAGLLDDGVGVCGESCEPYGFGACGVDESCFPLTSDEGLCLENTGTLKAFEPCGAQGGPTCGDNLRCIGFSETERRCLPFCDPTAQNPDATCTTPPAQGLVRFANLLSADGDLTIIVDGTETVSAVAFGEVTDEFFALTPGEHTIVARNVNGEDLVTTSVTVAANDAWTLAFQPVAGLPPYESAAYAVPRFVAPPEAGTAVLRIGHALVGLGAVDVVAVPADEQDLTNEIVLATNVAADAASDFTALPAGTYDIYVFDTGANRSLGLVAGVAGTDRASFEDIVITDGDFMTVYATGDPTAAELALIPYDRAYLYPTDAASYACLPLGDEPTPSNGACIQTCTVADYGTEACGGLPGTNACNPRGTGGHACFPGGGFLDIGDACEGGDCREGAFCRFYGDGTGICASMCETGAEVSDVLECQTGNVCVPFGTDSELGACEIACDGADFLDADCPTNLQSCLPATDAISYCAASGDLFPGTACGDITYNNCAPGSTCANLASAGLAQTPEDAALPGTCAERCEFFDAANTCGENQDCVADFTSLSTEYGLCFDRGANSENTEPYGTCAEAGASCGERAVCIEFSGGDLGCLVLCVPGSTEPTNCPTGSACLTTLTQGGTTYDLTTGPFGSCIPGA